MCDRIYTRVPINQPLYLMTTTDTDGVYAVSQLNIVPLLFPLR